MAAWHGCGSAAQAQRRRGTDAARRQCDGVRTRWRHQRECAVAMVAISARARHIDVQKQEGAQAQVHEGEEEKYVWAPSIR